MREKLKGYEKMPLGYKNGERRRSYDGERRSANDDFSLVAQPPTSLNTVEEICAIVWKNRLSLT